MPKFTYSFWACIVCCLIGCNQKDILLPEDTFTELTIKHERFPDFSFAGYEKNEKPIPAVPVKVTVLPGEGDDGANIQAAIDSVSGLPPVNGFRGAVLLKAGVYEVEKPLYIRASGVVLRGEGQDENGTVLIATGKGRRWNEQNLPELINMRNLALIRMEGNAEHPAFGGETEVTAPWVPVGATRIPVANPAGFRSGDTVIIKMNYNQDWINALQMAKYGWTPEQYQIEHRRVITNVDDDAIHINIPLVDAIIKKYGGAVVLQASFPGRISHSGIENLCLKSIFADDQDEAHTWTAIRLSDVTHSWVRNVTAKHFAFGCVVIFGRSDFNTIQDCAMLDPKSLITGNRRYSFYIEGGMANLFQRCYSWGGRHDFSTGGRVAGPNVFLDCYATNTHHESGPHHRWATGTLYDNVQADRIKAYNRADLGESGHGWAGAQNMFWNCKATQGFLIESPPEAINWCVGCRGARPNGDGYWASWGIPVLPRSLFLEQLRIRLGPQAVNNITDPSQRGNEDIWSILGNWAEKL